MRYFFTVLLFCIGGAANPLFAAGHSANGTRLILLGTAGGPAVKKARAQPANALVVAGDIYVVDAGDGVSRQMALAGLSMLDLRAVFITHNHSDHVADYGTLLLRAMESGLKSPVEAYGPPPLRQMTDSYLDYMRWDLELRERDENRPRLASLVRVHEIASPGIVREDENTKVTATEVPHGAAVPSYAYRFDTADCSVVFSGDTSKSEALIELAKDADVLVHEVLNVAGLDAAVEMTDPGNDALKRHIIEAHTSISDVGRVAARANVARLVLTHFVPTGLPQYDTRDAWLAGVREHYDGDVVIGEDLMEIDCAGKDSNAAGGARPRSGGT